MPRVGEEYPRECPGCGGDIRFSALITEPGPIRNFPRPSAIRSSLCWSLCLGSINAVDFGIEIENATLRTDAKERLASPTAGDIGLAI
jgi:hypothetical protein